MKRYYLSDVIGTGTEDDPYRAAIDDDPTPKRAVYEIPTGPDGRPTQTWVLCLIAAADHRSFRSRAKVDPMPDYPLSAKLNALANADRSALSSALSKRGIPTALLSGADSFRDVVDGLGKRANADFSVDAFDVRDVN